MRIYKTVLICFAILALLCAFSYAADEVNPKQKGYDPTGRSLALHRYARPYSFPMTLPTTNVGVNFGYFYSEMKYAEKLDFILFKEDTFKIAGLDETLDFEFQLPKPVDFFSIEGLMSGRIISGANDRSAIIFGGMGTYSVSVIPKANILKKEKWGTAITLAMPYTYDQGVQSSPIQLMVQVIDNAVQLVQKAAEGHAIDEGDIQDIGKINLKDSLIQTTDSEIQPAVLLTQTIVPAVGLQLGAGYEYGLSETQKAPEGYDTDMGDPPTGYQVGGVLDVDFNKVSSLAMGIRGELDYSKETNDDVKTTTVFAGGGIMYTGRKNLDLGLNLFLNDVKIKPDDVKGQNYILFLNMRYYFD